MWKAKITNNIDVSKTWVGIFPTQSDAQAWLDKYNNYPGRNKEQVWMKGELLSEEQETIALDMRLIEISNEVFRKEFA